MTDTLVIALTEAEEEKHLVALREARLSWRNAAADILGVAHYELRNAWITSQHPMRVLLTTRQAAWMRKASRII